MVSVTDYGVRDLTAAQFVVALSNSHLPRKPWTDDLHGRLARTNCDEAGDYVVPNALSPRDLVSGPNNMDETVVSSSTTGTVSNELLLNNPEAGTDNNLGIKRMSLQIPYDFAKLLQVLRWFVRCDTCSTFQKYTVRNQFELVM